MITLTYDSTPLALNPCLIWRDRYDWSPFEESVEHSLTGALIVQRSPSKAAGMPISLESDPDYGLVTRATIDSLKTLEASPAMDMTLHYHGTDYTVRFRFEGGIAVAAQPIHVGGPPQNDDLMQLTLRLRTV